MMCIGALLACLLLLACRTEIEAEPTPTPIPTEAPTPSPEPVVLLTVQEPTDAKTLSAQIAAEGTIETVVIDPGMLTNTDIAALLSTFPEVRFRYAVRLGDTYLPPDTASLSAENLQIEEIVDALPCFTALETVHLGMRTTEELAAAQRLLPGIALTYTTSLYG